MKEKMIRGQTSIEFIFLILIIIIYLVTIVRPAFESAQSGFEDIERVTKASNETQKLLNSINRVSGLSDGSKETIFISLPEKTEIICDEEGTIGFKTEINSKQVNPPITACPSNKCEKEYQVTSIDCVVRKIVGVGNIIVEKTQTKTRIKEG